CVAAGTAVKWSMVALLPLVVGVWWTLERRLTAPGRPRRRAFILIGLAAVIAPPLAVIAVSLPRELGPDRVAPAAWWREQRAVARFHRDLRPQNANAASGVYWATLTAPARLFAKHCPPALAGSSDGVCPSGHGTTDVRILAVANPVVWFAGLLGLVATLVRSARGDPVAAILLAAVATQWLPWVLSPRDAYSFYAVTLVPLLVLCAVREVGLWPAGRAQQLVPAGVTFAATAAFAVLWPLWSAQPLSAARLRLLTWWPGWW
ncbi:MAG: Dolichyl-phosphate-mannose--protein O-mannosyl transferase, partial [Acidimicrobiales bacterium]|nr:Dolichyl-phosphate-mannose--protein O-mannosyl transferase [Acidimicrobiales bacterium]